MKRLNADQASLTFDSKAPNWAYYFAPIGPSVRELLTKYLAASSPLTDPFGACGDADLQDLASALREKDKAWSDRQAAALLEHLLETCKDRAIDVRAIARWVLLHKDDPEAVSACMDLVAPKEIEIIRLLPRTGSQKLVFEARWRLVQKRVVLKRLTGTALDVAKVTAHELHSHPLSIRHPNIIETHFVSNGTETFLVEEWLPEVLNDTWAPGGMQQTANLFYCIAKAIERVHELGYVHGDIKPDNIGKKDDRFVLLDFGICRPTSEFTRETTATGSLRTRAPELLVSEAYSHNPTTVDIWALAATIFSFQEGRFPLVDRGEKIPRVSHVSEREAFERELARRAQEEWEGRIRFEKSPTALKSLLVACLDRRPENRPAASYLRKRIEAELPAYIPTDVVDQETSFAPIVELNQLSRLTNRPDDVRLIPADDRARLWNRVLALKERLGDSTEAAGALQKLESLLNA